MTLYEYGICLFAGTGLGYGSWCCLKDFLQNKKYHKHAIEQLEKRDNTERACILPPPPDAVVGKSKPSDALDVDLVDEAIEVFCTASEKHITLSTTNPRGHVFFRDFTNPVSAEELLLELEGLISDAEGY